MSWHTLTAMPDKSVIEFEKDALKASNVLPSVPECIISTSFAHIFSGGYASGYYSYKWAEVLSADGFTLFKEKGIFDKETADKFRRLLEQGGSVDAAELYRDFRDMIRSRRHSSDSSGSSRSFYLDRDLFKLIHIG